ncbi:MULTISPECIES: acyltransferase family protein [Idiomarina]|uniref:acyltransferase family protein n=1 Tax=Idiomarina TaxID=135575 RepID=UPI00129C7A19|nr:MULTISPECIES: acyltransferase family protein [Idiomarina]MRJ42988.1 hypothetical protein [Idiomarina sp. FeN1]NCU58540.1 hypothetical protein [Idiomarina sp. FenA--70]NCU61237.1 hypothetical protein [Idiomarina sp. FenBw--71]UUN12736.1 acyltransferase [Idiomarina loihiensis]
MSSFFLSLWALGISQDAAFYLTPFRVWEILVGALAAVVVNKFGKPNSDVFSLFGLLLLVFSFWLISPATPWPSVYTLLPCIGVILILLYTRKGSLVYRILSVKPMVFIGILSYSLYLWHQPVLAFIRAQSLKEPTALMLLIGLLVSFALAYISYRFFERPLRFGFSNSKHSRRLFLALFVWAALLSTGSIAYIYATDTVKNEILAPNKGLSAKCDMPDNWSSDCVYGDVKEDVNIVWGDSYAMHLVDGLLANSPNIQLLQMTKSSCAPTIGLANVRNTERSNDFQSCLDHNESVLGYIESNKERIRNVILASPFLYLANPDFVVQLHGVDQQGSWAAMEQGILETLSRLSALNISVTLVAPPPRSEFNVGRCLEKAGRFKIEFSECAFDLPSEYRELSTLLSEIALKQNQEASVSSTVSFVDLTETVCSNSGYCLAFEDDIILYRDNGHFTILGSRYLGRKYNWDRTILKYEQ